MLRGGYTDTAEPATAADDAATDPVLGAARHRGVRRPEGPAVPRHAVIGVVASRAGRGGTM